LENARDYGNLAGEGAVILERERYHPVMYISRLKMSMLRLSMFSV
jgi:hypothetical protein